MERRNDDLITAKIPSPRAERPAEIAQAVARLVREILGEGVRIFWFGSWPSGKARPHSDVDIALLSDRTLPNDRMVLLRAAIEGLPTLYSIDVVDLRLASRALNEEALRHGIPL